MVHTGEHLDPTTDVMITTLSLSWNALYNVKKKWKEHFKNWKWMGKKNHAIYVYWYGLVNVLGTKGWHIFMEMKMINLQQAEFKDNENEKKGTGSLINFAEILLQ